MESLPRVRPQLALTLRVGASKHADRSSGGFCLQSEAYGQSWSWRGHHHFLRDHVMSAKRVVVVGEWRPTLEKSAMCSGMLDSVTYRSFLVNLKQHFYCARRHRQRTFITIATQRAVACPRDLRLASKVQR